MTSRGRGCDHKDLFDIDVERHGIGDRCASDHRGRIGGRVVCSGSLGRGSRQIAVGVNRRRSDGGIYGDRVRSTVPGRLDGLVDAGPAVCGQLCGESEFVGITVLQGFAYDCVARGIVVRVDRDQGIGHVLVDLYGVQRIDVSLHQINVGQYIPGRVMEQCATLGRNVSKCSRGDLCEPIAHDDGLNGRTRERSLSQ